MNDQYDLDRFVRAQENDYGKALREITAGHKRSHWMWYVFPQLDGLACSEMSRRYSIKSMDEARAYLAHPVLGPRLRACALAVVTGEAGSATGMFGSPDDLKLRSSATLFASVSPTDSVFHRLLEKYFPGGADPATLRLIGAGK